MSADTRLDLGSVKIHKHVLDEIIAKTVHGINGVRLVQPNLSDKLKDLISGPSHPGIKIQMDEQEGIKINLAINIQYGMKIPDTARQIQDIVKQDIKKILEINVADVNIDIRGIEAGGGKNVS